MAADGLEQHPNAKAIFAQLALFVGLLNYLLCQDRSLRQVI